MADSREYVLGRDEAAGRRLEIQDIQFGPVSELLLDELGLGSSDRVVELGVGAGGFSRRILRRLGEHGVLVGVDCTRDLLEQARRNVEGCSAARFEPVLADASQPGPWLEGADVVVGRAVLHHFPWAEGFLGRLRSALRPGTRVGFIEPEFRALLGRIAVLEASGRSELAVFRMWAEGISRFYEVSRVSPNIGATMAWALEAAGYLDVQWRKAECSTDQTVIENLLLYYEEIREKYRSLGIMTTAEIDRQQELLRALPAEGLPAVWGMSRVTARA